MRTIEAILIILCSSAKAALGFTSPSGVVVTVRSSESSFSLAAEPSTTTTAEETKEENINNKLQIPLSYNEMILQASQAMKDASSSSSSDGSSGTTRQIVRILLPRDASSDNIGVYYEATAQTSSNKMVDSESIKLVPTDESWQGGIMQLYRAASPTVKDIIRQLANDGTGIPTKIVEDRNIDESGVDGLGLLYTQIGKDIVEKKEEEEEKGGGFGNFFGEQFALPTLSKEDLCVFVQPSQEVIDSIETLSTDNEGSLIALVNPQWRNVDDALDSASKNDNVFGAFASFLGGKGSALRRLDSLGFTNTYTLEGYVCKGGNIRLLKRFDSDWIVFAENDSGDAWVRVGQSVDRPAYQDVEKMLDDKGVGYKYARDLGLAPKL